MHNEPENFQFPLYLSRLASFLCSILRRPSRPKYNDSGHWRAEERERKWWDNHMSL